MGVYLALSARILVNLESLNMAESVGNVTKHRKAPVVYQAVDGTYRVVYVPVVSGMSLAHHYQVLLARAAKEKGLPVSNLSLQGYFLKYASDDIIQSYYPEVRGKVGKNKSPCQNEWVIVESDVVADVGGFLYTGGKGAGGTSSTGGPVKRTSRFSFSYMVPALDAIKAAAVYPQLHVRYTPGAKEGEQALIYVDNASALYTLSYVLEASEVSVLNTCKAMGQKPDDLGRQVRVERVNAAIDALIAMLGNMAFGAKRSRSLPHWKVESAVIVASKSIAPFMPTPGHDAGYIDSTLKRLEAQKQAINGFDAVAYCYFDTGTSEMPEESEESKPEDVSDPNLSDVKAKCPNVHKSLEEAINAARNWVISKL